MYILKVYSTVKDILEKHPKFKDDILTSDKICYRYYTSFGPRRADLLKIINPEKILDEPIKIKIKTSGARRLYRIGESTVIRYYYYLISTKNNVYKISKIPKLLPEENYDSIFPVYTICKYFHYIQDLKIYQYYNPTNLVYFKNLPSKLKECMYFVIAYHTFHIGANPEEESINSFSSFNHILKLHKSQVSNDLVLHLTTDKHIVSSDIVGISKNNWYQYSTYKNKFEELNDDSKFTYWKSLFKNHKKYPISKKIFEKFEIRDFIDNGGK